MLSLFWLTSCPVKALGFNIVEEKRENGYWEASGYLCHRDQPHRDPPSFFFTAIGALISLRFLPVPMSYSCIGGVSRVSHGGTLSLPVIAWD